MMVVAITSTHRKGQTYTAGKNVYYAVMYVDEMRVLHKSIAALIQRERKYLPFI